MTEISGAGEWFYKCDTCGKESPHKTSSDLNYYVPSDWYYIAMGQGGHPENADEIKHYCSKECRDQWQLIKVVK